MTRMKDRDDSPGEAVFNKLMGDLTQASKGNWAALGEGRVSEEAAPEAAAPKYSEEAAPEASEAAAPKYSEEAAPEASEAPAPERSMRQERGAAANRALAKSKDHQIFEGRGGYEYAYNPADDSFTIISSPKSRGGQVVRAGSAAHKAIAAERGPQPKLEGGGTYTEAALAGAAKASEALAPEPEEPSRQDKRFARQEKREEKMAERSKEDRGLMAFLRKNKPEEDDAVVEADPTPRSLSSMTMEEIIKEHGRRTPDPKLKRLDLKRMGDVEADPTPSSLSSMVEDGIIERQGRRTPDPKLKRMDAAE